MKPIPQQLEQFIVMAIQAAQAADALPAFDLPTISITPAKNPEHGDYACPVAMALAKTVGRKPLDIAETIRQHWPQNDLLSGVEVAPPGFLNLRLSDSWLRGQIEAIIKGGENVFAQDWGAGKRAQVEFVSANPTGPLSIGRTRGAVLGDTMARILETCGWTVEREYYFNNAGKQMEALGKSLQARYLMALGREVSLPEEGYRGSYLIDIAQMLKSEVGDSWADADWPSFKDYAEKHIFELIKATLERIRIRHDHFFNESSVYDDQSVWHTLERMREKGVIYEAVGAESEDDDPTAEKSDKRDKREYSQPATWFRSTSLGDNQDRVLVKSNGDPTYALPDIAYHINKLERGYDLAVNILGADHIVEARTVAYGLTALGYDASKVNVLLHQFVTFGSKRMSTRAGNYVLLDELIDDVGADVVRYFMLMRSHNSTIDFDLDLALEQSKDNPVYYIQNAHVRCCGILRQVEERGYPANWDEYCDLSLLGEAEMGFIRKMLEMPEALLIAHERFEPHQVAFYALDLARLFHPLYDEVRVLHSEVPEDVARARLRFYRAAKLVFARVLDLMGMSAPERM